MQNINEFELLEIIDSSSVGSFICDMEKGEIYYSYEWSKRLGIEHLSPREATSVSTTHVHPEDREHIHRVFLQACEQKAAKVKMEFRAKTVDSGYIWILGQGKIIYNQEGRPVKYYGTHSDITERKRVEEEREGLFSEAEKQQSHLLSILKQLPVGVAVFDKGGTPFLKNELMDLYMPRMIPSKDPRGIKQWCAFDTEGNEIPPDQWPGARALRGDTVVPGIEFTYTENDGQERWITVSAAPLLSKEGEIIGGTSVANDITERKRMEEALQESKEKYHNLFESLDEGYCIIEVLFDDNNSPLDYRFLEVNQAFERQTGLVDATGRYMREMAPDHEQHWFDIYGRIALTGEPVRFQNPAEALGRFYDVYAFRIGQPQQRHVAILFNDIGPRKQAEEALRESEEKYRTIFETSQEGIWVINGNDQTVMVNERLQQMLGYTFDELLGKSPQSFMAPEFQAAANERLVEHMGGKKEVTDYRLVKKDGSSLWCILSSTPLFDKNGKFDGSIAMITDITDRKRIEVEKDNYMKIAEERAAWLQAIMDLIPAGIWISDHTGKVTMVNQEAINMYRGSSPLTGSPEEYTSYKLFLPGTDEPVVFEQYVPNGALIGVALDFERFDGTRGTQVASTEALRDKDGNIINYVAVSMDITPLRQAEIALQESEKNALDLVEKLNKAKEELINALHLAEQKSAEWKAIADAIPDGLTVYGKNGEILYMNDTVKNTIGDYDESVKSNLDKRMREFRSSSPNGENIEPKDTALYIALNNGEITRDCVAKSIMSSGKTIYSSHSCAPIKSNNGEITGAVMIHKDITERVALEKKTDELVEELREADQNKNAFINMLSHELRNPLASIMISLDLMDKLIPEEQRNYKALEIAKRQGKQLTNLVDDLLDVTRISQNKIALKKETVELNELINKAVQDFQPQFIDKNVKLEIELTTPLFLEADPSRITQVIGNLLHNARKFTRNNDLVTVAVSTDTNNNEAVITVQDTGRGIDSNNLKDLFEPFTQVDKTLDRSLGGLGLGLAIVKGMVELHGGRVEAFSEGIGKGAKFTIWLPLPEKHIGLDEGCEKMDAKAIKSLKILIIDDNRDLAEIICELIGFLGYETESAHNGADGIAKARELQPDVIICDIGLPGISGYEVAKLIRKDADLQDTFLIALSGYAQPEDIEKSKEAGFDRHLAKPVSLETLQMFLNEVK